MVAELSIDAITAAVAILQSGDRCAGKLELQRLWNDGFETDPYRRCIIAHFLADTEEDVAMELAWDIAALEAATGRAEGDADPLAPARASFLPSLHLNVGDAYRRIGNLEQARFHAKAGLRRASVLEENGYGSMIKTGLDRLHMRTEAD